jgi:uncharacterized membrane protein
MGEQRRSIVTKLSTGASRWRKVTADKLGLIVIAILCSAVVGGFFWAVNHYEVFGDGKDAAIVALVAYAIYAHVRMRRLERRLEQHGLGERIFSTVDSPKE